MFHVVGRRADDKNAYCGYDLRLNKVLQVKNDPKATMYYYDRMRFSYDNNNFFFDNFISETCYELRKRFAQLLPFLSPDVNEVSSSEFYKYYKEKFNHYVTSSDQCPSDATIKEVNARVMLGTEADYEDPSSKYFMAGSDESCGEGTFIYFIIFIISAVVAGLLTIAFICHRN
uniref:Uncharacterized protein n=1 Tax=Panagrolaimus superbus TaxID=310955 RepID=A0A914YXX1_9BILA